LREGKAQGKEVDDVFMEAMKAFSSKTPAAARRRPGVHPSSPRVELWKEAESLGNMNMVSMSYGNEQAMSYSASNLVNQANQNK
jgi:hypothetical protein